MKTFKHSIFIIAVCFLLIAGTSFVYAAWADPTVDPPNGNVDAPLNIGGGTQYKAGSTAIGGVFETDNETHLGILGGLVGIGTDSPNATYKLDILGGGRIYNPSAWTYSPVFTIENLQSNATFANGLLIKNTEAASDSAYLFKAQAGGANRFLVTNSGKVGINKNNPGSKLDVEGNILIGNVYTLGGGSRYIGLSGDNGNESDFGIEGSGAGAIEFQGHPVHKLHLRGSGGNRRALTVDGYNAYVGIGTTSPNYKLDVAGNLNVTGSICIDYDCKSTWPATGSSLWTENGSDVYRTAGNVGIGVSSPIYKLHVDQPSDGSLVAYFGTSAPTVGNKFGVAIAGGSSVADYALYVLSADSSSNFFYIRGDGNIGMGNTAPDYDLDVTGDINASGDICISGDCKSSWPSGGSSVWTENGSDVYRATGNVGIGEVSPDGMLHITSATNDKIIFEGTQTDPHTILLRGTQGVRFWDDTNGELMRITQDGKVGIGTSDPSVSLEVANGRLFLKSGSVGSGPSGTGLELHYNSATDKGNIYSYDHTAGSYKHLELNGDPLILNGAGNRVGIGTLTPAGTLDVQGDICISGDCKSAWPSGGSSLWTENGSDVYRATGNVGIGTGNPTHARLQIDDDNVPLAFQETGQSGAGSLWRMPLDGNQIRFDASQNGTDFTPYKTPLTMRADGLTIIDSLNVNGMMYANINANPLLFSSVWQDYPAGADNRAEISNDTGSFKTLMIVGNKSDDGSTRKVSIWDRLEVNGSGYVSGNVGIGTTDTSAKLNVKTGSTNGIFAESTTGYGIMGKGSGSSSGVRGYSDGGTGVYGDGGGLGTGVRGITASGIGVHGSGNTGVQGFGGFMGVYGIASQMNGAGVYGESTGAWVHGVRGVSTGGYGVLGESSDTSSWKVVTVGSVSSPGVAGRNSVGTGVGVYGEGGSLDFLTSGGAYSRGGNWTNASDKNKKENFISLDSKEILEKILELSITEWNYKTDTDNVKHIGPMAQDFYRLFKLGDGDKSISTIDPAGISLLGIQALNAKIENQEAEIENLKARLANFEARLQQLEK